MPIGGPFRRRLTTSTLGVDYFWTPIMAYFSAPIDNKESVRNTGNPIAWSGMINRTPVRDRPGALGWRRGSQYRRNRVTPGEGRDLSSRQTQDVARDLGIGQPINSAQRSETADGVARESEGRTRLPLLGPLRQDQPRGHSGARLCPVPLQQGRAGRGPSGLRGRRGVRGRTMAGRTGACAQAGDLPTGTNQARVHTEGQRQTQAAGHLNLAGSGLHDRSDAGAGADLRSRPSLGTLCLPSWAERPTGGGRGGGAAVSRPSGRGGRRPRGLLGVCFIISPGLFDAAEERGLALYHFDP